MRRVRRNVKHRSRPTERVPVDENFREGWGLPHDRSTTPHYFIPSTAGTVVSLCRVHKQYPVWVVPSDTEKRFCAQCAEFLERRRNLGKVKQERTLRTRVGPRIAAFLANPKLGPRLYGCPECNSVYEGFAPTLFPCRDGHPPVTVVELARKDTWTKDKSV
jgi:hypothetical protein